jgi:FkbM family methyltransferase
MIATTEAYGLTFRYPAADTAVGATLRDHGEFARPELDFLIDSADGLAGTYIDVGANIGVMSLPFAKARPDWKVIAVEAFGQMAGLLTDSARDNGLTNVQVMSVAAGDTTGLADFPAADLRNRGNFGTLGFYSKEVPTTRKVPVVCLDDIAPPDTRIIKVDVEGYEPQVFRGATRTLETARPIVLFEAHQKHIAGTAEIAALLGARGYSLFWFFAPFVSRTTPLPAENSSVRGDMNIVGLPPGAPNRWNLPPAPDPAVRPAGISQLSYLQRYGF